MARKHFFLLLISNILLLCSSSGVTTPPSTQITTPSINNPSPSIVTVPSNNPIIVSPKSSSTPVTIPSATPVSIPNTNPMTSPFPVTNPVTTPSTYPVTNPATNPFPTGGSPVVPPPVITNSPGVSGQSWCVAKSGSSESSVQGALDYSCGNGADCTAIQEGGACYIPTTLMNHASYAFNSYYQKNPAPTSCDFGGTATLTNSNPSTGSCIYPSSSSSSPALASPTLPVTTYPAPATTYPTPATQTPTPSTESSTGATTPGVLPPPFMLNSSNPATVGGTILGFPDSPLGNYNSTSTSKSTRLKPLVNCILLVIFIITSRV